VNFFLEKIGIVVNPNKKGAVALAKDLQSWARKKKKSVRSGTRDRIPDLVRQSDMLICLGGDGTILNVAHFMTEKSVPVLGVNLGGLGFLTGVKAGEVYKELDSILSGTSHIEERLMLRVALTFGRKTEVFQGLNDAVMNRDGLTRYLRVTVKAGGEDLMGFSGDGLIVATPTGSTAYSLSAGGPFVHPTLSDFLVTPLSAHSLLTRPIVLPSEKAITVTLSSDKEMKQASVTVDGQTKRVISSRHKIEITKAPLPFRLIRSSRRSYLETLREKFGMVQHG
jgi:NAD+ kinase